MAKKLSNENTEASQTYCELLPWYVNGKLTSVEFQAMEEHFVDCDACRAELPVLRVVQESLRNESISVLPPTPNTEQILAQIGPRGTSGYSNRRAWLAGAVAASVVLLTGLLYWSQAMQSAAVSTDFHTATDVGTGATFDYVLLISVDERIDENEHQTVLQTLKPVSISGPDQIGQYRVVVRLPARSMDEIEQYRNRVESGAAISSVSVVAVELPVKAQ